MFKTALFTYVIVLVHQNEGARILAHYPTPSISHQVVFRPLTLELVRRGHEVVVITTDPIFSKGEGPTNLKEIDVRDVSYSRWKKLLRETNNKIDNDNYDVFMMFLSELVELQIKTPEVQKLLNDKSETFDLVIVEAYVEVTLGLANYYKAPVIQFSSLGAVGSIFRYYGAPVNYLVYPSLIRERVYNLTAWEKVTEIYNEYKFESLFIRNKDSFDSILQRTYGPDTPSLEELKRNVDLLFLNIYSIWDFNRPVPPNIIYLGGLHQKPQKELPQDLQKYLDSSKNGIIYVSFGTNVDPGLFSPETIQIFVNVFSKLPYDILWKWNQDELPGRTKNIKISKWLPQSDLLRHPKIKLFITQGGLQSTDEAITAGVPLIGIPILGDQKFNVEQYLHFKIGEKVEIETITGDKLNRAINVVLQDNSYRKNVERLRSIINDQPQPPLERAVWWVEYAIRYKGAKHLRSPAANMTTAEYFQLELVTYISLGLLGTVCLILHSIYLLYSWKYGRCKKLKKH